MERLDKLQSLYAEKKEEKPKTNQKTNKTKPKLKGRIADAKGKAISHKEISGSEKTDRTNCPLCVSSHSPLPAHQWCKYHPW